MQCTIYISIKKRSMQVINRTIILISIWSIYFIILSIANSTIITITKKKLIEYWEFVRCFR